MAPRIGAATAALFSKEGADLVAVDIQPADGVLKLDVTDHDAVRALIAEQGPFDIVLNVAGVAKLVHFADQTIEEWNRQLAINLTAPMVVCQAAMPGLIERKGKHDGQMIGRSPWLQSVHVETVAQPGDIIEVTLVAAGPNSMTGAVRANAALSFVEGEAA